MLERILNAIKRDQDFRLRVARGTIPGVSAVHIYGRNPSVDTTERVLWSAGAAAYTWLSAASTVRVKAGGNAADTLAGAGARKVLVRGLNSSWTETTEELSLAGASASSPTSTSFFRVLEAYVSEAGTYATPVNTGDILIETTGGTEVARLLAGRAQSRLGLYTVPSGYTLYLTRILVSVEGNKSATLRLTQRQQAQVVAAPVQAARLVNEWPALSGVAELRHDTWEGYPACTDIWLTAQTASGTTAVSAEMEGFLVASA